MSLWDKLRIIDYVNKKLAESAERGNIIGGGFVETKETQADKPSAHSSFSKSKIKRIAYSAVREAKTLSDLNIETAEVSNTNSMEPFLDDNCIVLLEETPVGTEFWAGDIVVYQNNNKLVIHELKEKTTFLGEPAWIIKGKNNFLPDMVKVMEKDIIKRYFGHFVARPQRDND